MGTTFVGIKGRGFWMQDGLLELWLRLLALHIEDPVERDGAASRIRDQWLLASRGFFNGCVPEGLEQAVSSTEGAAIVRRAIGSLLQALEKAPRRLSQGTLNLLGSTGGLEEDVDTRRLIEVGQAFLDLLDGKIKGGPQDTTFMPGRP